MSTPVQAAAQQGATAAPAAEEEVNLHFAAFVAADGALYELDGRFVVCRVMGVAAACCAVMCDCGTGLTCGA